MSQAEVDTPSPSTSTAPDSVPPPVSVSTAANGDTGYQFDLLQEMGRASAHTNGTLVSPVDSVQTTDGAGHEKHGAGHENRNGNRDGEGNWDGDGDRTEKVNGSNHGMTTLDSGEDSSARPVWQATSPAATNQSTGRRVASGDANFLNDLGEKIFLDRYALKDMNKANLCVGDLVVVCVNTATGQREIGNVIAIDRDEADVELGDGEVVRRAFEHLDRPLEIHPDQMQARVARGIAAVEAPERQAEWGANFRWLLEGWKFVPGGRILTAAGTDQELTFYNCYVVPSPSDSRDGIIRTLSQMTEIMSRGGGVGINLSSLRPRYAYVRGVNGRSSGSVSWGSLYSFVTGLIEQGGSRRGALMLILDVWHPDVREFISAKRVMGRITNANISLGITDDFMAAVEADAPWNLVFPDTSIPEYGTHWNGDLAAWRAEGLPVVQHKTVRARELWQELIESAWASAEPGLWFKERANKQSNSWYYAPLVCTNPCVTGETLVYTSHGLARAKDLCLNSETIDVVLDSRFGAGNRSRASAVFPTGRKPVYRVQTREGYFVRATADHRIMTHRGWVPAGELASGDRVHLLNHAGGFGETGSLELGQALGWLVGDGPMKADAAVLSFLGAEKAALAGHFASLVSGLNRGETAAANESTISVVSVAERDEARVQSTGLRRIAKAHGLTGSNHRVPESVFTGSADMQRGFLSALFTAHGSLHDGGAKGGSVRLAASHLAFLEGSQQLLLNFGIVSRIRRGRRPAGYRSLPDGRGGQRADWCQAEHELVISRQNLIPFAAEIGFMLAARQAELEDCATRGPRGRNCEPFSATIESVTFDGVEDVYDLTEPLTHSFVANGIVVHNCGEQPLPGWSVCNLGALNLAKFAREGDVDWDNLGRAVRYAVRFLDNVIDATPYFFEENRRQQLSERRVGMGTMGLAELMIRCGVRYGSAEGNVFLDKLYQFMAAEAYLASADNAAEKGSFPFYDGEKFLQSGFMRGMPEPVRHAIAAKGCRNVTLITQAPTGTTGTMVGTSTGIEPFFSWSFFRKSRLGMHEEKVAVADEWLQAHPGASLPPYFVTSMDLAPEEHVGVQAAIQRWVDSSISKTCNVPNGYTIDQTRALYELMYRLGCKGGTVYRDGSRDEQVLMLKDDKAATPASSPQTVHSVQPRPRQMMGMTYRIATPLGKAYITVNRNPEGDPFEVFVNLGKAGSDLAADAEAIGRLISLIQRLPSALSPVERMRQVVEELDGIGGSRAVGFGTERVRSLPDGISHALAQDLTGGDEAEAEASGLQPTLFPGADLCPECGHASLLRIEGCRKCFSCGFSEC